VSALTEREALPPHLSRIADRLREVTVEIYAAGGSGAGILWAPDSDALRVGAVVVALGHPLGLRRTLTAGVVHALAPASPGGRRWIHADLRLAPGNSGGPLADTAGDIVGINTMIVGGLALAIPINEVRRFVASAAASTT
jgi:S1-C subfamily serine protease